MSVSWFNSLSYRFVLLRKYSSKQESQAKQQQEKQTNKAWHAHIYWYGY